MSKLIASRFLLVALVYCHQSYAADHENSSVWGRDEAQDVIVRSVDQVVNVGNLKTDDLEVTFQFSVETEADSVNLTCLASNMGHKQGASTDPALQLKASRGCRIAPINALSLAGQSAEIVEFKQERHKIDGHIDALKTDYVTFKTPGMESFKQKVFVTVSWIGNSRTKPVGNYEASVTLLAAVPDNIHPAK